MKAILAALVTIAMLSVNVVAAQPVNTATPTASATVLAVCGISATNVAFGSIIPGDSSETSSTVSMPEGNTATTSLTVKGTAWTGGTGMPVGQTSWKTSGSYAALETTESASIGSVSFGNDLPVDFKLDVPAGQAAGSYSQTITFTASC
jgi:hypothetical protein